MPVLFRVFRSPSIFIFDEYTRVHSSAFDVPPQHRLAVDDHLEQTPKMFRKNFLILLVAASCSHNRPIQQ